MANVLILKQVENSTATCDFVVIATSENKLYSLTNEEDFNKFLNDTLRRNYDKEYDSLGLIYTGNLNRFYDYSKIVDKMPKRGVNGVVEFRDYTKSYEEQLKKKSSVVVAEDTLTSWNTAKSALGATNPKSPIFGVILEVIKTK